MSWPRRVLCLLAFLTATLLFVDAVLGADLEERLERNAAVDSYVVLEVPNQGAAQDADAFLQALCEAAEASSVNIYRKVSGWTEDDRPYLAYYALVVNATSFFEAFSIEGTADIALTVRGQIGWSISVSGEASKGEKVAVLRDILGNDACSINSMELAFGSHAPSGTYYVEAPSDVALSVFAEELEARLVDAGGSIDLSFSYDVSDTYDAGETRDSIITYLAALACLMLLAMAAYCQLADARRRAVVELHGAGPGRSWFQTGGALLCDLLALAVVLTLACSLLVPGTSLFLVSIAGIRVALPLLAVVAASFFVAYLTKPPSIPLALKGREGTRGMAGACLVAKAVICAVLVGTAVSAVAEARFVQQEQARYANWEKTSEYALFFPLRSGYDANDMLTTTMAAIALDLYPEAVQRGALYVDAIQYLPEALEQGDDEFRSMIVNPNYLEEYPVYDTEGNPIVISEAEEDWVLLVPESRREDEAEILAYWETLKVAQEGSVTDADLAFFGRTVSDPPEDRGVRIVWTAAGQDVFAFSPEVGSDGDGSVRDPIIEVMTLANSVGLERSNAITGSMSEALKVRIEDAGVEETYEAYLSLLQEVGLDDNLQQLVTVEGAVFETLQGFREVQAQLVFRAGVLLAVSLFLAIQSASLLFDVNARRAAVKRMYGYGFVGRTWPVLLVFVAVWAAAGVGALCFSGQLMSEVVDADLPAARLAVLVLVLIDAAVFVSALVLTERRCAIDVLKGAR